LTTGKIWFIIAQLPTNCQPVIVANTKKNSKNYVATRLYLRTSGLGIGDRLPGERELAVALGMGRAALRSALEQLELEGIVRRQPQSGTFLTAVPTPHMQGARIFLLAPLQNGSNQERDAGWLYRVISSIERTVGQAGGELILQNQSPRAGDPCSVKDMVREAAEEGAQAAILLHPLGTRDKIAHALALLHDRGVHPLIVSARTYSGLASQVYFDSGWGAYLATRHLLQHGHTRIGFAGASSGHEWVRERLAGYHSALDAADIAARDDWASLPDDGERSPSADDGAAAWERWQSLPADIRPTGILAANDVVALGLLAAAQAEGATVPKDLSLIGFDNDPAALLTGLTTVERPTEALGEAVARVVLERLAAGRDASTVTVRLRPVLIERATVGAPHSDDKNNPQEQRSE
jgi:DNA-binding LacI/PurR family transcriptional regulator